ncbi:TPA: transcriptional regulator [Salmonella enterica subsp. enterica serovar Saintpaul str. CFSAN004155]|nr:transcriptional regulator [Salmonella enterica]EBV7602503.1 transcriptional regulator [Salmonella enterica subsp. enterica serovar Saintpaul]ECM5085938.1 transcriptional regulator [Salmonella enterica subsp. enterica serovar Newport]ECT8281307.1 transcriptional regulator [Salmonella enterica subsp. enterica]HCZ4653355.1 transcriptional regulator [Salmonella enterica subsp. enterica serovar Saintpaul str. CFSAN004157]HCZ4664605.1 transcriptional regulator [Salmonella enterica subsp. enterica
MKIKEKLAKRHYYSDGCEQHQQVLLIVLTEDCWLYTGLVALLPEMACLQAIFCAQCLPREVRYARRVIIAVDSRIMFRGEWTAFNSLKILRPDATIVWLIRKETGRLFPTGSRSGRIVHQQQDIVSLRLALRSAVLQRAESRRVVGTGLTPTERRLLPFFLSGRNVPELSQLTGKSVKTLYSHRHKILSKTGFRQLSFLKFVYERNHGLPGISGLGHIDVGCKNEGRSECTV